ncbi:MAG: hypothetical protein AMXMBFR57_00900 [Acidimicrobiia bacterium]
MRARSRTSSFLTLAVIAAIWTVVVFVQGAASHADTLRRGAPSTLGESLAVSALAFLPWIPFTALVYRSLSRRSHRRLTAGGAVRRLAGWFCLFYLPQVFYQVLLAQALAGRPLADAGRQLLRWPLAYWLVDFTLLMTTVATVYAVVMTRAAAQAETQRLDAIRGQLEPHFLFNALNAISALVRTGNTTRALTAIQQLSALLRLVLTASRRDWVTIEEELALVREYVTLQQLRFGDRLVVNITGDTAEARAIECPSLLLQPLVENAIRHGVERQQADADVTLTIDTHQNVVFITVENRTGDVADANPGMGLGLTSLQERLSLLYGDDGAISTDVRGGRFVVSLRLPRSRRGSHP